MLVSEQKERLLVKKRLWIKNRVELLLRVIFEHKAPKGPCLGWMGVMPVKICPHFCQLRFLPQDHEATRQPAVSLVLAVPVHPERVPSFPTIAGKDVQIPIETKQYLTSVVVGSWLVDLQDDPKGRKTSRTPKQIKRTRVENDQTQSALVCVCVCEITVLSCGMCPHSLFTHNHFN